MKTSSWAFAIITLIVIALILAVIFWVDWSSVNDWFAQPISTLNIGELIIIVAVCNMIFSKGK